MDQSKLQMLEVKSLMTLPYNSPEAIERRRIAHAEGVYLRVLIVENGSEDEAREAANAVYVELGGNPDFIVKGQ